MRGFVGWLLGDTRECVAGQYAGDRTPRFRGGMFVDPAQTPTTLMKPSMEAGQSPSRAVQPCYAYLLPERKVARTVEVTDDVMVDVDAEGCPVGIETLDGSAWQDALVTLAMRGRVRIT